MKLKLENPPEGFTEDAEFRAPKLGETFMETEHDGYITEATHTYSCKRIVLSPTKVKKGYSFIEGDFEFQQVLKPSEGTGYLALIDDWVEVTYIETTNDWFWVRYEKPNGDIEYRTICTLYTRKPAKRVLRECWVGKNLGESHMRYETAAFCSLEEAANEAYGRDLKNASLYREVIPPEKKELPDSDGSWVNRKGVIFDIKMNNGKPKYWQHATWHIASIASKGEWIKLDDRIKQAWKDADDHHIQNIVTVDHSVCNTRDSVL